MMNEQKTVWKPTVGWSRAYVVICILYAAGVIWGGVENYKYYTLPSLDEIVAGIPKHLKHRVHYDNSIIGIVYFKNKNGVLQQSFPAPLKDCPIYPYDAWSPEFVQGEGLGVIVFITRDATLDNHDSFYKLVEGNYKKVKHEKLKEFWMYFLAFLFIPPIFLYISGKTIYWIWQGFTHKEQLPIGQSLPIPSRKPLTMNPQPSGAITYTVRDGDNEYTSITCNEVRGLILLTNDASIKKDGTDMWFYLDNYKFPNEKK